MHWPSSLLLVGATNSWGDQLPDLSGVRVPEGYDLLDGVFFRVACQDGTTYWAVRGDNEEWVTFMESHAIEVQYHLSRLRSWLVVTDNGRDGSEGCQET